jgi:MurNAc alpha-1-phosphate uridylyltransferase
MVLAAGLGTRMRPMTLTKPKPLQTVGGKAMLDHALDKLVGANIRRAVVNTHYLPEQIEDHLAARKDIEIVISREETLLDTGGGIAKVLPLFEGKAFFSLNADLPWLDGDEPSLTRMKNLWDHRLMSALLLVMLTGKARGFDQARGDFALEKDGRLWRKDLPVPRPYVWISAQILTPALFINPPSQNFSNNYVWNLAEKQNRLYGLEHDGTCYHVGTPEDWQIANDLLASGKGWGV